MLDHEKIYRFVKKNQVLRMLTAEELKQLIPLLSLETYKLGEVVIRQGESSDGYFVIVSGKARVVDPQHDNITLAILKKYDGFGEQSLLFGKPANATVRASGKLHILKLAGADFRSLVAKHPEIEGRFREIVRRRQELNFLRTIEILSGLTPQEINTLIDRIETIELKRGEFLFHEGDQGDAAYIIRAGKIRILHEEPKRVLGTQRPGTIIGEIALVKHQPRAASAKALENVRLYKLTQKTFQDIFPKIRHTIEQIISNRMLQLQAFISKEEEDEAEVYPEFYQEEHKISVGWLSKKVLCVVANHASLAGLACVAMLAETHKKSLSPRWNSWAAARVQNRAKDNLSDISRYLEEIGFLTKQVRVRLEDLHKIALPAIVLDEENIPCVLFDFNRKMVLLGHPLKGILKLSLTDFWEFWNGEVLMASIIPEFGKTTSSIWSIYATFLPLIRSHKTFLVWIFALSSILMLLGLATPFFTRIIIDKVLVFSDKSLLHLMLFGMIAVAVFQLLGSLLRSLLTVSVWQRLESLISTRMFHHVVSLPIYQFEKFNVGDYTTRFEENRKLLALISDTGMTLVMDVLTGMFYLMLLFGQNPRLMGLGMIFILGLVLLMIMSSPRLRENNKTIFEASAKNASFIIQILTGIQTVKSLASETNCFKEGMEILSQQMRARFIGARFSYMVGLIATSLSTAATLSLLAYGAHLVLRQQMTIGEYVAFSAIYGMFMAPLGRLVGLWDAIHEIRISYERVNDILQMPVERSAHNHEFVKIAGYIRIENLSFRYEGAETNALSNINLEIQPGQKVALVGRSGCGKSTLVNLILGFQQPVHGRIYIDNIDTTTINPASLRKHIGVVEQKPFLFEGTIRENIMKADPDLPHEQMAAAAAIAGVKEFTDTMPMGFDTRVGEDGMNLSGGQRQRIAIARAIAREPEILILDEATSALDTETEMLIQKNLEQLTTGRTTFVIAHRLSTVMDVDLIVVMDEGRIVETGTHASLMERKGLYYYLFTSGTGT